MPNIDNPLQCRLCSNETVFLFRQEVLQKYDVAYFHCPCCELIQTENPYWLDEAYGEAISSLDTGSIRRNESDRRLLLNLFDILGIENPYCIDYGGGAWRLYQNDARCRSQFLLA